MSTEARRYTQVAVILHWIIAVLMIGQLAGGKIMENLYPLSFRFEVYQIHKSFGVTILILSFVRLGWRLRHKAPPLPDGMKPWETFMAKFAHVAFYVLIIGIPIAGWLMVSASPTGIDTYIFTIIPWPHLPVPVSEPLESLFKNVHEYMATGAIVLIVLHVGAALKHHYVNRDDVLTRMLPFLKPRG